MGVKFKSPLELSGHRAIAHTDVAQTLVVKVVTKTNAHPEYGNGSSNGYTIDGVEGAYLEFTPGNTYKFDQADSSNSTHPLRFYEDAAKTTAYTTGVTTSGTPGSSGAYTQIIPTTATPPILYYQCSAHSLMGSYVKFGTGSQGDTYTLSASQDGNNVDLLLDAGSGTDSTVQLTAGNNITLTRNNAQEVTIASTASGGGGTVTVQKNVYTGDGSDVTFDTTSAIANENNVQVYLDGVYQSKDNYTTSGSTVTMSTAPANGTSVELIHMVAVDGVIARDSFTGNGSTTAYVLSMSISNENATQVYLDGVYQSKDNYSTSGSTLTFSTAPPNGTAIEVVHIKAVNASSLNQNNFTGDGSTTAFTLSQSINDETKTFVFIQGVYQEKSTYSISGTTLTFTTAPQNGYTVEVMAFSTITVGNQVTGGIDWQSAVQTSNFTAAAGKGYFVNTASAAITVSLPAGTAGAKVSLQDYTGTFNSNNLSISANGSEKIRGLSNTTFNNSTNNARVDLVYQDATEGWQADNIAQPPITVSYLVIAGGGAGAGYYRAGGGGAGGLRTSYGSTSGGGASAESNLTISSNTNYTVTVGAGAAGASNADGGTGSNSVFSTITSIGGGGGGKYTGGNGTAGTAGGSGGGGGGDSTGGAGGAGTANQGYAGGTGASSGVQCGGGGGGAGAVGKNGGSGATDGDGGDGIQSAILNYANAGTASVGEQISGSQVWYAGGGGGGSYSSGNDTIPGKGGGGEGVAGGVNYPGNGGPATANTGGGGGGASGEVNPSSGVGGSGGSGIVILRYPSSSILTAGAGLTQSSGSPFTEGSNKVSVFTAGTGNITFS